MNKAQLSKFVAQCKAEGKRIVLTSGSWDILHVGHMRYLLSARNLGDVLIVGVDSDTKIRKRKGKDRPVVPEKERLEMLSFLECVDALYVKTPRHKPNALIKIVMPDVLVVSETTNHGDDEKLKKQNLCGEICVLPPQAQTSTTARIRLLHIDGQKRLAEKFLKKMPEFILTILEDVPQKK